MKKVWLTFSVIVLAVFAVASNEAQAHGGCDTAALQNLAPTGTTILAANATPASPTAPAHCLVKANVATPGNVVEFRLALPEAWNGKFLFQGVGGFAGSFAHLDSSIARGYAAATTNTGHQGTSGTDGRWALDHRPREIDYGYRGVHVTAQAAQRITNAYYGNKARFAYFNGCSNGGRQALMEAQRFPDDFDGIVAGDPSFGAMGFVRRAVTYRFMLGDADRFVPPAKLAVLSKATLAACDASDGLKDGLIGDPRRCSFDPSTLTCKHGDAADCLTPGQVALVKLNYSDMITPDGQHLQGYPVGHEAGATGWARWITGNQPPTMQNGSLWFAEDAAPVGFKFADGFFRYLAFEHDDADYDWRHFDLQRDLAKIKTMREVLSPTDADLRAFQNKGKKLLLYHGWADPALSAYATLAYYQRVVNKVGGQKQADNFIRLFFAPGMHHCRGGAGPDTFDTLTAMEQWVETGKAPEQLIATHFTDGKADRTRPLCPEPKVAKYIGKGNINAAENFRCQLPGL